MQSSETLRKPCFTTQKELDEYEKYINNEIFISAWNDMLKQVMSQGSLIAKASNHNTSNISFLVSFRQLYIINRSKKELLMKK